MQTIVSDRVLKAHHFPCKLMGCGFVISAIDGDPQKAWDGIRAGVGEIERIERLISSWQDDSETSSINKAAGISSIVVSKELYGLIERSLKVSDLTAGAFDISGTLARDYWNFNQQEGRFLSQEEIHELRGLIDYRNIHLDRDQCSVYLSRKGMKIGFGGIGKGYAARRAAEVMKEIGIVSGLINASGDLMSWGDPLGNKTWKINIPDPHDRTHILLNFSIPEGSVVTSGNFENYTLIDGEKYSHIVDPRTALPVKDIKNVSVVCVDSEFADAMATAISVMGVNDGLSIVNRLNGIECTITDSHDQTFYSDHFNKLIHV